MSSILMTLKKSPQISWRSFMRLGSPILGLLMLIGISGFWLLSDIAKDQDDTFAASSHNFVSQSMDTLIKANATFSAEYSVWDDAVANIVLEQNDEWLTTNYFALATSAIAVYKPSRGLHYLFINSNFEETRAVLQDAIPALSLNQNLRYNPLADNAKSVDMRHMVVLLGGRLAAVSVQPLQPEKNSPLIGAFKKLQGDLVVSVTFIGQENIDAIGASFGLTGAKLHLGQPPKSSTRSRVNYLVRNANGTIVGWIDWHHAAPGSTAYQKRILPILFGLFMAGLLAAGISYKIVSANLHLLAKARSAEEASRTKSTFLANVSHELRTPLNTIIGYSEMIEEESQDAGHGQTAEDAKKVTNSAQHLLALINDLLDHSKIEAGKMDLNPVLTPIEPLLRGLCDAVQSQIGKNNNQLVLNIQPNLGDAWLDGMRLKQCLLNLLSNAAKFTRSGTITLHASIARVNGLDHFIFKVTDTGLGMSAQTLERLFSPFVQANETVATKYGGTGLGLVITKSLITAMDGTLDVASEVGIGSRFTITFARKLNVQGELSQPSEALAA